MSQHEVTDPMNPSSRPPLTGQSSGVPTDALELMDTRPTAVRDSRQQRFGRAARLVWEFRSCCLPSVRYRRQSTRCSR